MTNSQPRLHKSRAGVVSAGIELVAALAAEARPGMTAPGKRRGRFSGLCPTALSISLLAAARRMGQGRRRAPGKLPYSKRQGTNRELHGLLQ